ncbi:hypothetical protein NQ318_010305 [Aromia moschata]|uniref:Integrase p58-like C-terminal domain-containing protein n=1 Tax=Aromia moschata TaxID=1265417 RepID=A0AAV8XRU6_9CUCU|nr:hypothetical protein NQ318_010305 [Aromia moschata]
MEKRGLLLLDTGATRTIIRPDIVGTAARITPTSWRLRTATGDPATIRGETNVTIVIGNVSFEHRALVAEIEDELILGMDIMNTKGFELDFKNNVLKINGEEIVLHRRTEETIRVVLAEDTAVPERSEMILDAHLDGNPCVGNIMMFEPRSHDGEVARGIAVGKALLRTEKTVPVRIMNLNHHPVNLRKGIVLGYCSSVSSVIRKLDTRGNSVGRITGELSNLLSSSSRSLRSDQTTKLRSLITKYADIFDNGQGGKGRTNFLHLFLLAYRSSVHETTGQTPASIVMGRELRLPCDLKFGCTPGDDVAGEDYVSTLRQRMDDIHERVRSNIQGASNRMKETYDISANDGRYQPGNQVWLYNPQRRRGLSPKLQSSWEGPYEVVTRINDVVYRIQKLPRGKPRVVHFNRLALSPEAMTNKLKPEFDTLLLTSVLLTVWQRTSECPEGLHLPSRRRLDSWRSYADKDQRLDESFKSRRPSRRKRGPFFYLVTKQLSHHKPTYQTVWDTLVELRDVLLSQSISSLAIPKIASGLDGLDWRVIRSMLEVLFRFTGIEILVCCYNPQEIAQREDCGLLLLPDLPMQEWVILQVSTRTRGRYNSRRNVFKEGAVLRTLGQSAPACFDEPAD